MPIKGYRWFGGEHWETAAVRNVLAFERVSAPHTGKPFTEAFLLGLGGGIGAGYFVFQYGQESSLFIGTRARWDEIHGTFSKDIVTRIGGTVEIQETASAKKALTNLVEPLDREIPLVTWVNRSALPYEVTKPAHQAHFYHTVVVCGRDADRETFEVDDRAPAPWTVTAAELATARASIASQKNRTMTIVRPKTIADLKKGVRAGLTDCVNGLRRPRTANFGLASIKKWSELVANPKDKRGWPSVFRSGPNLFRALFYTYYWIEAAGTGGGAHRRMFADFLGEAASVLGAKRLEPLAGRYRTLAQMWTQLAEMALPDDSPMLKRAKTLVRRKTQLLHQKGPAAAREIKRLAAEIEELMAKAGAEFEAIQPDAPSPLSAEAAPELFERLRQQIGRIYTAEDAALTELEGALEGLRSVR